MGNNIRNSPVYENCEVYSPDNKLMFRCLRSRCEWYLKRGLAVALSADPFSIKLTFQPKGEGEKKDLLKVERKNICVVCGDSDIRNLTRHHIIPYEYRKYFPSEQKAHNSLYVVPLCEKCHSEYETEYAIPLKKEFAEKYNASFYNARDVKFNKEFRLLWALLIHNRGEHLIPHEKISFIKREISYLLKPYVKDKDLDSIHEVEAIIDKVKQDSLKKPHGQIVVEEFGDTDLFQKKWARHFIENMKPKYLPEYLKGI